MEAQVPNLEFCRNFQVLSLLNIIIGIITDFYFTD